MLSTAAGCRVCARCQLTMSTLTVESCDSEDELRVGFGASRGTCGGGADSSWRVRAVFAFALRYASPRHSALCCRVRARRRPGGRLALLQRQAHSIQHHRLRPVRTPLHVLIRRCGRRAQGGCRAARSAATAGLRCAEASLGPPSIVIREAEGSPCRCRCRCRSRRRQGGALSVVRVGHGLVNRHSWCGAVRRGVALERGAG